MSCRIRGIGSFLPPRVVTNAQVARELDITRQQIDATRNRTINKDNEIKSAEKERVELQRVVGAYQQKLEAAPLNEQQYNALLREFNLAKQDYEDMSKRHDASETAQSLEEHKAGENLAIQTFHCRRG